MPSDRLQDAHEHMKIGGDHRYAELLILSDIAHSLRGLLQLADFYSNGPR